MPALDKHLGQGGTRLSNFIVSTGVCCPARTSLLSGRLAHCTNVTSNYYPSGGFRKVYETGIEASWLPVRLAAAGYSSYLVGKYLNEYFERTTWMPHGTSYSPAGWTVFDALTVNAYNLTDSCFSLNAQPSRCFPNQYQTDLIRDKALGYLRDAAAAGKPFLMYLAPTAPHRVSTNKINWFPPTPAARHARLYPGIKAPVTPNWGLRNPAIPRPQAPPGAAYNASMDALYGGRLRSLRAIDEMLDAVVNQLQALELLDNTYVIFASDNGYHMGAFGLPDGKNLPIEEDARVPLYVRGPGVPAGQVLPYQGNMVDITPTLLALAGLPVPDDLDGLPLPITPQLIPLYARLMYDATMLLASAATNATAAPSLAPPPPLPGPSWPSLRPVPPLPSPLLMSPVSAPPRPSSGPSRPLPSPRARPPLPPTLPAPPLPLPLPTPPTPSPLRAPPLPSPWPAPPLPSPLPAPPLPSPLKASPLLSPWPAPPLPLPLPTPSLSSPLPLPPTPSPLRAPPLPSPWSAPPLPSSLPTPPLSSPLRAPPLPSPWSAPPQPSPGPARLLPSPLPVLPPPSPWPTPPLPSPVPARPRPSAVPAPPLPSPPPTPPLPSPVPAQLLRLAFPLAPLPSIARPQPPSPALPPAPPPVESDVASWLRRDAVVLEGWNGDGSEDREDTSTHYKALRWCTEARLRLGSTALTANGTGGAGGTAGAGGGWAAREVYAPGLYCYKYVVWCQGQRELYDLAADPYETRNRIRAVEARLLDRVDGVLSALVHCRGAACRSPYGLLHPGGGVFNFSGTLEPSFDEMYAALPKLQILSCTKIYNPANEPTWTQLPGAGGVRAWTVSG